MPENKVSPWIGVNKIFRREEVKDFQDTFLHSRFYQPDSRVPSHRWQFSSVYQVVTLTV